MLLQAAFHKNFAEQFAPLNQHNTHIMVAISGGLDSVVLTHLLLQAGFNCTLLHCNFQLRGDESKRDENFVQQFAQQYQLRLFIKHFDTENYAAEQKVSIQQAARDLRYAWFKEELLKQQTKLLNKQQVKLATAHHANDNIETVLMNIFRGTGIKGLQGIPVQQQDIIRPLLFAKRQEIEAYANTHGLQWVEDSSNQEEKYTRNFFRHQLIPLVSKMYPQAEDNLLRNINRWNDVGAVYNAVIEQKKKKLVKEQLGEWHLPLLALQKEPFAKLILLEIISAFHFTAQQLPDVLGLLNAENSKYVASSTHRIIRNRKWLIIAPINTIEHQGTIVLEPNTAAVVFKGGSLQCSQQTANVSLTTAAHTALLDIANIEFPLLLRPYKTGDYFYPLGMTKKKKVARFLSDMKLSSTEKEKVWVLESNKRIVWVVGHRIDNRFKLKPTSQEMLVVELQQ